MGHKANPIVLRLGIVKDCESTWFATKQYPVRLMEDLTIRQIVNNELKRAGISQILIRRKAEKVEVDVHVARPGMLKNGNDVSFLQEELSKKTGKSLIVKIIELKNPEMYSRIVGEGIAQQLEKRVPFRRAMKMAVQRTLRAGALGVKIMCAGRLGGVEIARSEWYREGKVPLHTLRADIDYSFTEALTTYGKIGIKVWIYKGEILNREDSKHLTIN